MLAIPEALLVGEPRDGNPQWFRLHDLARSRIEDGHVWTESAVNQVVSKRMVKKQQLRWTPRGAHLLLQVRTRVLNDDLATEFQRWYPAFVAPSPSTNAERAS